STGGTSSSPPSAVTAMPHVVEGSPPWSLVRAYRSPAGLSDQPSAVVVRSSTGMPHARSKLSSHDGRYPSWITLVAGGPLGAGSAEADADDWPGRIGSDVFHTDDWVTPKASTPATARLAPARPPTLAALRRRTRSRTTPNETFRSSTSPPGIASAAPRSAPLRKSLFRSSWLIGRPSLRQVGSHRGAGSPAGSSSRRTG